MFLYLLSKHLEPLNFRAGDFIRFLTVSNGALWKTEYWKILLWRLFLDKKKLRKQLSFRSPSERGADRIWTGGYWCCRPLPYHLATAPYLIKMTPTGIEPVLPPWKGDVLTAWPWSRVLSPLGVSNVSDKKTPRVGLEPTTTRLTAECSTIELSRNINSTSY